MDVNILKSPNLVLTSLDVNALHDNVQHKFHHRNHFFPELSLLVYYKFENAINITNIKRFCFVLRRAE